MRNIILLIAVGIFLISGRDAQAAACRANTKTSLVAGCANAWDLNQEGSFYAWSDYGFNSAPSRKTIKPGACKEVFVVQSAEAGHMAKIRCGKEELWVNLDLLACAPTNLRSNSPHPNSRTCNCSLPGSFDNLKDMMSLQANASSVSSEFVKAILDKAKGKVVEVARKAKKDQQELVTYYSEMTPEAAQEAVARSERNLKALADQAVARFGPNCDGKPAKMSGPDAVRGQRTCKLLLSSAKVAKDFLAPYRMADRLMSSHRTEASAVEVRSSIVNQGLYGTSLSELAPVRSHEEARNRYIEATMASAREERKRMREGVPYWDLAFRMVLLHGLPEADARVVEEKLVYKRESYELGGPQFIELHNGYIFGGRRIAGKDRDGTGLGYDCSDLIGAVLSGDPNPPTSTVFRDVARYLDGEINRPSDAVKRWSSCFSVVDLREGMTPQPADLVVSVNLKGDGHIVIVNNYDERSGTISTVEAAGGSINTVTQQQRPLFEPSCSAEMPGWQVRPVRADLRVLRFKAESKECPVDLTRP